MNNAENLIAIHTNPSQAILDAVYDALEKAFFTGRTVSYVMLDRPSYARFIRGNGGARSVPGFDISPVSVNFADIDATESFVVLLPKLGDAK